MGLIIGRVTDPAGKPLGGVRLTQYASRLPDNHTLFEGLLHQTTSLSDGGFRLVLRESSRTYLLLEKDGFAPIADSVQAEPGMVSERTYVLSPAGEGIHGTIRDKHSGRGLPAIAVGTVVMGSEKSSGVQYFPAVFTDRNGHYEIPTPPLHQMFFIWASGGDYLTSTRSVTLTSRRPERMDLELVKGRRILLEVQDIGGTPIEAAQIQGHGGGPAFTDAQGRTSVVVAGNEIEQKSLGILADGYLDAQIALLPETDHYTVRLTRANTLLGRTLSPDGSALAGCSVTAIAGKGRGLRIWSVVSDEYGRFELPLPRPDVETVHFRHPDYFGIRLGKADLPPPGDEIEVVLKSGRGVVAGRVLADGIRPATDFRVTLRSAESSSADSGISRLFLDRRIGDFRIENLPDGLYEIRADGIAIGAGRRLACDWLPIEVSSSFNATVELAITARQ